MTKLAAPQCKACLHPANHHAEKPWQALTPIGILKRHCLTPLDKHCTCTGLRT